MFHGVESLKLQFYWNIRLLKGGRIPYTKNEYSRWTRRFYKSNMHSQKKEREPQYVKIILSRKYYREIKELLNVTQQFY